MLKLYCSIDAIMIGCLRGLLEANGIQCLTRNELLSGGAGGLPVTGCWPELWICHDEDWRPARRLLDEALCPELQGRYAWRCENCLESIEAQFGQCWNCGRTR